MSLQSTHDTRLILDYAARPCLKARKKRKTMSEERLSMSQRSPKRDLIKNTRNGYS